ncbi:hypothetical protein GCM10007916_15590 [Psychromonas marina]|uniref:Porin n=1 Tax=Psychromonas marina TaxID=88364 RepID=A0ABQ6DZJ1_9GAMM|nr:hypothetical protein [Psychromonas marina]GLS90492.1 hypothetical protein GCM10007916_15590 [Psychromonas marina]
MKKTLVSAAICLTFSGAHAASLDDIKISGFGSVAVGKSNNDVGYAGYTSERWDVSQDTLAGIQLDVKINDKAKFVTQVVSNARYDYDLSVEMAYVSYDFGLLTARLGKLRTPMFMYSDYLDVGYAYPMLRPSQELYENLIISSYTGMDLLIPIEFDDSSLVLQPIVGIGEVNERDSQFGKVTLDKMWGLTAHWYVGDFTFRGSYVTATTSYNSPDEVAYIENMLDNQKGQFISLGMQYDNGDMLAMVELADTSLEGEFSDTLSASGLFGYRFDNVMPYLMVNWVKTTDNDERDFSPYAPLFNFERMAYSIGTRWDFAKSMAFKVDLTYADYQDTSGGFVNNIGAAGNFIEADSLVYSAAVDFVF